jgi:hypothetical protein
MTAILKCTYYFSRESHTGNPILIMLFSSTVTAGKTIFFGQFKEGSSDRYIRPSSSAQLKM